MSESQDRNSVNNSGMKVKDEDEGSKQRESDIEMRDKRGEEDKDEGVDEEPKTGKGPGQEMEQASTGDIGDRPYIISDADS